MDLALQQEFFAIHPEKQILGIKIPTCAHFHFATRIESGYDALFLGKTSGQLFMWKIAQNSLSTKRKCLHIDAKVGNCHRNRITGLFYWHEGILKRNKNGLLISASEDRSLKVWNIWELTSVKKDRDNCVQTLSGHQAAVVSIISTEDGGLLSISMDGIIKIWRQDHLIDSLDKADVKDPGTNSNFANPLLQNTSIETQSIPKAIDGAAQSLTKLSNQVISNGVSSRSTNVCSPSNLSRHSDSVQDGQLKTPLNKDCLLLPQRTFGSKRAWSTAIVLSFHNSFDEPHPRNVVKPSSIGRQQPGGNKRWRLFVGNSEGSITVYKKKITVPHATFHIPLSFVAGAEIHEEARWKQIKPCGISQLIHVPSQNMLIASMLDYTCCGVSADDGTQYFTISNPELCLYSGLCWDFHADVLWLVDESGCIQAWNTFRDEKLFHRKLVPSSNGVTEMSHALEQIQWFGGSGSTSGADRLMTLTPDRQSVQWYDLTRNNEAQVFSGHKEMVIAVELLRVNSTNFFSNSNVLGDASHKDGDDNNSNSTSTASTASLGAKMREAQRQQAEAERQIKEMSILDRDCSLFSCAYDDTIRRWDEYSNQQFYIWKSSPSLSKTANHRQPSEVSTFTLLQPYLILCTGHENGIVSWRSMETSALSSAKGHSNTVSAMCSLLPSIAPRRGDSREALKNIGEKVLATVSYDGKIGLWSAVADGRGILHPHLDRLVPSGSKEELLCVHKNAKHNLLIVGGNDTIVRVYNLPTLDKCVEVPRHHRAPITEVTSHENYLFTASEDGTLAVWNLSSFHFQGYIFDMGYIPAHSDIITAITHVDPLELIVTCSRDKTIKIWDYKGTDISSESNTATRSENQEEAEAKEGETREDGKGEEKEIYIGDVALPSSLSHLSSIGNITNVINKDIEYIKLTKIGCLVKEYIDQGLSPTAVNWKMDLQGQAAIFVGTDKGKLLRYPLVNRSAIRFETLEDVQTALRRGGLQSSELIIGIDFTKSNEWTGQQTFQGRCMHEIHSGLLNPYEQAMSIIAKTLFPFDDDNEIPAYGFGCSETRQKKVFSLMKNDKACDGLDEVLFRYREIAKVVRLSGPTNFAPLIYKAIDIVKANEYRFHVLLILADGQVNEEAETIKAIVDASHYPLAIVQVGVGDGPWEVSREFDDQIEGRLFDNWQFVEFHSLMEENLEFAEPAFAIEALDEIPDQFNLCKTLKLLGPSNPHAALPIPQIECLEPPETDL